MSSSCMRLFIVLFIIPIVEPSVQTLKSIVIDYTDLAGGKPYPINPSETLFVYGTGDIYYEDILKNIRIRVNGSGDISATLYSLMTANTDSTNGRKTALVLPPTQNYTITDENPAGTATIPYYIYITRDPTTISVYDVNYDYKFETKSVAVVMSPFRLMILRNFDIGNADNATVLVSTPDEDIGSLFTVVKESANISIATIFGPIATIKPNRPDAEISFIADISQAGSSLFTPGARLAYASPGFAGLNTIANYGHPLAGKSVNHAFKSSIDFDGSCVESHDGIKDGSITVFDSHGKSTPILLGGSDTGSADISAARSILVQWQSTDKGFLFPLFNTRASGTATILTRVSLLAVTLSSFARSVHS